MSIDQVINCFTTDCFILLINSGKLADLVQHHEHRR
jgi:hypothetical protein